MKKKMDTLWLGEERIMNAIDDELLFRQGKTIADSGSVVEISRSESTVYGVVKSSNAENRTIITFDENLQPVYCSCSCMQGMMEGKCRHIAATLHRIHFIIPERLRGYISIFDYLDYLEEYDEGSLRKKTRRKEDEFYAFEYFDAKQHYSLTKEKLKLEIEILMDASHRILEDPVLAISMRIGSDKLYNVKVISDLIQSRKTKNDRRYGKFFHYRPKEQKFGPGTEELLDYLTSLYDVERLATDDFNNYRYGSKNRIFSGKSVMLSELAHKKHFLKLLNATAAEGTVHFIYDTLDERREMVMHETIEGNILLPLALAEKDGQYHLVAKDVEQCSTVAVTEDYEYVIYRDKLHHLSEEEAGILKETVWTLEKFNFDVKLPDSRIPHFIREIYPQMDRIGSVDIPEVIQERIVRSELESRVYLEGYKKKGVRARIEFVYGDHIIEALKPEEEQEIILIRNGPAEQEVISMFADFKKEADGFVTEEEKRIFHLLHHTVPRLQTFGEVFYDKNLKLRPAKFGPVKSQVGISVDGYMDINFETDEYSSKELADIYKAIKMKKEFIRLKDGRVLDLDDVTAKEFSALVDDLDIDASEFDKSMMLPLNRALYFEERLKDQEEEGGLSNWIRMPDYLEFLNTFREPEMSIHELPEGLKGILRHYQEHGFQWLKSLRRFHMGGILADDMGLGKTLQAIAFIASEYGKNQKASLIIAPTSLVFNWEAEVKKFAPWLKTLLITGSKSERDVLLAENFDDYAVVITSYPLVVRDFERYSSCNFASCFIDEAQYIKNPASQRAKTVKKIKAAGRFAMTGTPIENNLTELWSIFDFVMPGYLYKHSRFIEFFEKPIAADDRVALEKLKCKIRPFLLRRLKGEVLKELPEKTVTKSIADLYKDQKKLYLAFKEQYRQDMEKNIYEEGFEKSKLKILSYLIRLRQVCCHPAMFDESYKGGSGKMDLLMELVHDGIESGHKMLVFSQFTTMLGLIASHFKKEKISYLYLDGSIKAKDRQKLVQDFQDHKADVFLISLKAGGTGLNLTAADVVIHVDPWWNPAAEEQASDRAHRIGQKNNVQVFKLITRGTIEEKIYQLQEKKRDLIQSVIEPGESPIGKLTEDELRGFFD